MKVCIAVFILSVVVLSEGRIHDELRRRRQIDNEDILDVFGIPNQGGSQFGQGSNQFGQTGGDQFGGQFGGQGGQFGQGGRPGQGGQFGQGGQGGQFGGDPFGNQFGQGQNQFGQQGQQGRPGQQQGQQGRPGQQGQQGGNAPDFGPTTTTQSPRVRNCITNCQTTPQYNPVCGSNGIQYMNIERLNCARRCGVDVTPLSRGTNCS